MLLILLWIVPFWLLAPAIAHALNGLSSPPSVADVTTAIVVVQTVLGLLGSFVAGTEVKAIVKGASLRHAIAAIWSIFIHGEVGHQGDVGDKPGGGRAPRTDA